MWYETMQKRLMKLVVHLKAKKMFRGQIHMDDKLEISFFLFSVCILSAKCVISNKAIIYGHIKLIFNTWNMFALHE